ncbi:MAG: hypothetical protein ABIQ17_02610, partial [Candidatus Limnocylindrales bacterium]
MPGTPTNPTAPTTERELLASLEAMLTDKMPDGWSVSVDREPRGRAAGQWRPDAVLVVEAPNQARARLAVEVRASLYPRDAYALSSELGSLWLRPPVPRGRIPTVDDMAGLLVLSRFLTDRTRSMLEKLGFSYADATGNLRIVTQVPPLFIETSGADSNPWAEDRPLRSLRGPASARVVRALLDFKPPYPLRRLADLADLPLGSASRVVSLVVSEALVERTGRSPIERVDWKGLLRRWSQDYAMLESNRSKFFLEPRGPKALEARLPELGGGYAVTGSLAASRRAEVAPAALAAVYVRSIENAASDLGLRSAPSGGNVVLLEPRTDVAFERTWDQDGTVY